MSQAALIHDGRGGIWPRYYLTGPERAINAAPWHDALAQGGYVGTCRACGGYLRPAKPYRVGSIDWYPARCEHCRTETAAAGPRPKPKPKPKPMEKPVE